MFISKKLLPLCLVSLALIACKGGGGDNRTPAEKFVDSLSSLDYNHLYEVVKENTIRGGAWVVVSKSDYYTSCDTQSPPVCTNVPYNENKFAIDLNDPTRTGYGNDRMFFNGAALGVGYDPVQGNYFDAYGNRYQKMGKVTKDINVLGAKAEDVRKAVYANEIQSRYGLSTERSFALAKMGMDLKYLAKKNGSLSAKDNEAFEKFAFGGVRVASMVEHLQTGNLAALQKDKEAIARANGITADDVTYLMLK